MIRTKTLLCAVLLLSPAVALGGTVKMKSGKLVEGKVTDAGDRVFVETEAGQVSVPWRDVDVVLKDKTPADLFRARYRTTDTKDAKELFALALWAGKAGLVEEQRDCLAKVLAVDPEHAGARKALDQQKSDGAWRKGGDLLASKGFVAKDGRWVLKEEADMLARRGAAVKEMTGGEKRVQKLLEQAAAPNERVRTFATKALAGMEPGDVFRPALRQLRRGKPDERRAAARVLATLENVDVVRPLIYSAIMDTKAGVRAEAVQALVKIDHADMLKPFGRALFSKVPQVRMNAAEGLGAIGGSVAVEYLVRRVQSTGGIATRNHFSSMNQMSYISDFDVEIAQAAQIGDPIVGTLREGVVLDTRVLGVVEQWTEVERRVFYRSLRTATNQEIGDDPVAWKTWWEKEGKAALAAAEQPAD